MYVVLEAQYQSALTAAVKHINRNNDKVRRGRTLGHALLHTLEGWHARVWQGMLDALQLPCGLGRLGT